MTLHFQFDGDWIPSDKTPRPCDLTRTAHVLSITLSGLNPLVVGTGEWLAQRGISAKEVLYCMYDKVELFIFLLNHRSSVRIGGQTAFG